MSAGRDDSLPWTGERYVPQVGGNIRLEHVHRYLLARELSHNKRVLDIACGEGYGSDILATVAMHVVGVDIAADAVAHAGSRYRRPNLEFKQGACDPIPLPDHSVDVVVSFETLEHVPDQEAMLREIRRVLYDNGLLVISSPERHEYTDVIGNRNPYHVKELDRDEFERLMRSHFLHVALVGQRIRGGSIVGPLDDSTATSFVTFPSSSAPGGEVTRVQGMHAPEYLLALASDRPLQAVPVGLLDGGAFAWASDLGDLLSQVQGQCAVEIARRFGDPVDLTGASSDAIRTEFNRQADRVSEIVGLLAARGPSAPLPAESGSSHTEALGNQLLAAYSMLGEANARLSSTNTELAASRAIAKAHAAAAEWLERKMRRVESDFEVERRASRDSEGQVAQEAAQLVAHLAASRSHAAASEALLAAAHNHITELRARILDLHAQIDVYEHSLSWRVTSPLRAARRLGPAGPRMHLPLPEIELPPPERLPHDVAPISEPMPAPAIVAQSATGQDRSDRSLPQWLYEEKTTDYVPLDRSAAVDTRINLIAFYLPQFHPIPENDAWWGKGFTEWTSVTRGKPQFEGHYQPHLPDELGFYDLRLPEIQRRQIDLARLYGLHGFCYHHYWFHGKKLLRQPLDQLLARPELDFPFCLCWANESWSRRWDGQEHELLVAQHHSPEDDLAFIQDIEPALRDPRYIRIGNRPVLIVYRPALLPDAGATAARWRVYCREAGLGELFLMSTHAFDHRDPCDFGFDAALEFAPNNMPASEITATMPHINPAFRGTVYDYQYLIEKSLEREAPHGYQLFRSVTPMWDNEARRPSKGTVYANSSPALYGKWLTSVCHWTERHVDSDKPFVFVNAWNEWAEGAHLEPDRRYGYAYLQATADALERFPVRPARPSIVVVSHDAHLHGAQVLALNLARTLSDKLHYNVELILCGPGVLATEFDTVARVHDFFSPGLTRGSKLALARRLYDQGARIAICNTAVVGEAVELFKLAGFSVVSLIHELPGLIREHKLETSVERIVLNADRLVFPAETVRDQFIGLSSLPADRSLVQPQGLFAPNKFFGRRESARRELREQLGIPATSRVVLAIAYADHRKGVDLFADVGVRVAAQLADVVFVWVGHQEPSAFARARVIIEQAGMNDRFIFPGPIRDSDLFFAGADAYLLTSREDPFPSVVLQSMDMAVPVIAFEGAGGFVELLRRGCGVLVPFVDTDAMAKALLRLLQSPAERERLALAGREILSRDFSFVNYTRTLIELVRDGGPTVSVVVPNFNYAQYLPQRLNSIINQTYPPHEVLFLDDCSSDNSVEIAAGILHASGLAYRIITNDTNQGTYRQWLRGCREAKSDLLWIAEADDDCAPDLLEKLVGQFEQPDVMLAYCQSRQIDGEGREIAPDYLAYTAEISETKWRERYVRPGVDEIRDTLVVKNTIPNVSAVLMRRTDLSSIEERLVTLRNAGDWLLYTYLLERGDIAFVPDVLNAHRRHASSATIGGNGLNLMREILMVQQHVLERHRITTDAERQLEISLQRTYEYLGLGVNGPPSYKDHEALRAIQWAVTG